METQEFEKDEVYRIINRVLREMDRCGIDRIVLSLQETEPDESVIGRWISTDETQYYPYEFLSPHEQRFVQDGKNYTTLALVSKNVGSLVDYGEPGVEICERTYCPPQFAKIDPLSNLNYVTKIGLIKGEKNLGEFSNNVVKHGWHIDNLNKRVNKAVGEYQSTTKDLLQNAGVYDTLDLMEQREFTPFEKIQKEMLENIDAATYK